VEPLRASVLRLGGSGRATGSVSRLRVSAGVEPAFPKGVQMRTRSHAVRDAVKGPGPPRLVRLVT